MSESAFQKEHLKPFEMMYQGKESEDIYVLSKNYGKAYIIYTRNLIQKFLYSLRLSQKSQTSPKREKLTTRMKLNMKLNVERVIKCSNHPMTL